jgi:hypothetical protein
LREIRRGGGTESATGLFIGGAFTGAIMFAFVGGMVAALQRETMAPVSRMMPAALLIAVCSVLCLFGLERLGHWSILAGGAGGVTIVRATLGLFPFGKT